MRAYTRHSSDIVNFMALALCRATLVFHPRAIPNANGWLKRERERESPFWLKCCTFAWGLVPLPCIGGGAGGLTWTVPPGEPSQLSQRCLSPISDATVLKRPWVAPRRFEQYS